MAEERTRDLDGAATIASWALSLAFVVRYALAQRQRWAWWLRAPEDGDLVRARHDRVALWPNVLFNVGCIAGFALPLALTYGGLRALIGEEIAPTAKL